MSERQRDAIERLLYEYCHGIDTGDFAATAALFGVDGLYGLLGSSSAARGSAQVLAMMRASVRTYEGVPRTRHVVTNVCIDIDPDGTSASARSYVQVIHQPPGGAIGPIVVGTYLDRLQVVDGAWQFRERRMQLELTGDLSTHLQPGFL